MRPPDEPGPAVLEAMEPVDHVPFEELLRGVQEDLPAGERRVHPDQVDRVLELVAEAVGPARLVEPAPGPDPLGERLVLQPVEVAVELRAARSGPGPCPSGSSHHRRVSSRPASAASGSRYLRMTASARARSSAWPRTHDDRASRRARGPRSWRGSAAIGRSSRVGATSGSPCSTSVRDGRRPGRRRRTGPGRSRPARPGRTWRRTPARCGTCSAGSRRTGRRGPRRGGSRAGRSTPAGRPAPSGNTARPAAGGPIAAWFRIVSR